jgi:hypothetical protein
VDPERLAAYVAGGLDADERAEIEAQLARDPALRAEAARLERVEEALAALPPAAPAPGFEDRLRDHVAPVLDEVLADEESVDPHLWVAAGDELAARRRGGRWMPAVMGAAAAVVLLGVAGVALQGLSGDDTADVAMDDTGETESAELHATGQDGPTVLATDRDVDAEELDELVREDGLAQLRDQGLGLEDGSRVAGDYTTQLQAGVAADRGVTGGLSSTEDAPAPESDAADDAEAPAEDGEAVDEVTARCLDVLLDGAGDPAPIPAYVELLRFEGQPAIAYALLTPGGGTAYDRVEIWVVDRGDCQVLQLRQHDRD